MNCFMLRREQSVRSLSYYEMYSAGTHLEVCGRRRESERRLKGG